MEEAQLNEIYQKPSYFQILCVLDRAGAGIHLEQTDGLRNTRLETHDFKEL